MGKTKHMTTGGYSWDKIGRRIKKERKAGKLSQADVMLEIGRSAESYRLLGKWERGTAFPCLDDMLKLCRLFNCELGYLLCEHDTKTRQADDIKKVTGLSEKSIRNLSALNREPRNHGPGLTTFDVINAIFSNKRFVCTFAGSVKKYCGYSIVCDERKGMSDIGDDYDDLAIEDLDKVRDFDRERGFVLADSGELAKMELLNIHVAVVELANKILVDVKKRELARDADLKTKYPDIDRQSGKKPLK